MAKNPSEQIKQLVDLLDEQMLVTTILRYARSGHATPLMVEQAILLVEKHIAIASESGDQSLRDTGINLKRGLEQALVAGVGSLRVVRGPGLESTEVEAPLARDRRAAGHHIRRQHKCTGGIIDIYDLTADELIECKYRGTSAALGEATSQLQRYRKSFPGAALAIAVLSVEPEAMWLADLLQSRGITIIEIQGGTKQ